MKNRIYNAVYFNNSEGKRALRLSNLIHSAREIFPSMKDEDLEKLCSDYIVDEDFEVDEPTGLFEIDGVKGILSWKKGVPVIKWEDGEVEYPNFKESCEEH